MDEKIIKDILRPLMCTKKYRLDLLKIVHENGFDYVISEIRKDYPVKTQFDKTTYRKNGLTEEDVENAILEYLKL